MDNKAGLGDDASSPYLPPAHAYKYFDDLTKILYNRHMRIHMLSIGTTGDVRPMVLLGKELKRRGHIVQIAAFEPLGAVIRDAGLLFYCLPGDVYNFISELIKPGTSPVTILSGVTRTLAPLAEPFLTALLDASKDADALALSYFGSIGYSIAEKLRIPCFQMHFYPMDSNKDVPVSVAPRLQLGPAYNLLTYSLAYLAVGSVEYMYVRKWRQRNGMRVQRIRTRPNYTVGQWDIPVMYAISPQIMPPCPNWPRNIHMVGFLQPMEMEEFDPPASLTAFLANEPEKTVYVGFGSMRSGDMREALRLFAQALLRLNLKAVVYKGWADLAAQESDEYGAVGNAVSLPNNIYLANYIPHSWLFPRVAAVVHHGGAGTTAAGLYAGKPTLIVPFGGDQPFWGHQIYNRGLGPRPIPRDKLTLQRLMRALYTLVNNPVYKENAQYISRHLQLENAAVTASDVIEAEYASFSKTLADVRQKKRLRTRPVGRLKRMP